MDSMLIITDPRIRNLIKEAMICLLTLLQGEAL